MSESRWIGLNIDLSQAESRVTDHILYYLTGEEKFRWRALVRPADFDQHTARASAIFGIPTEAVTKTQRYLGKKTVHAFQRGMGADKLQGELLKDGFVYSEGECQQLLRGVDVAEPELKSTYFPWVREQIILHRELRNSWGRRIRFEFDRFDEALYRRGYSFFPQSEVSDWMNQHGTIPFFRWSQAYREAGKLKINAHVHDSLFVSVQPEIAYETASALVGMLETPRVMYGHELVIPCEVEVGLRWKPEVGWKQMPTRDVFEEVVETILRKVA